MNDLLTSMFLVIAGSSLMSRYGINPENLGMLASLIHMAWGGLIAWTHVKLILLRR